MTTGNLTIQDNDTVVQYALTGLYVFSTTFPILEADELKVSIDQALLTYGTHYTITGLGEEGGVEITLTAAGEVLADAGDLITLWQDMPIERLTGFSAGAATLLPEALNDEFAARLRVEQQLRREIRNALRIPPDDPVGGQDMVLPGATTRAGLFMAFGVSGQLALSSGTGGADSALRADLAAGNANLVAGTAVYYEATAAETAASAVIVDGHIRPGYVERYGAVGDGLVDCTVAIQTAINQANQDEGSPVRFLAGIYRFTDTLIIDEERAIDFGGVGAHEHYASVGPYPEDHTTLLRKDGDFDGINIGGLGVPAPTPYLHDFGMDSVDPTDTGRGIVITQVRGSFRMQRVTVQDQGSHGIHLLKGNLGSYDSVKCMLNGGDGFRVEGDAPVPDTNACVFNNLDLRGNTGWGFNMVVGWANFGQGITTQSNVAGGVRLENARQNYLLIYSEANTGPELEFVDTADCKGNFVMLNEGFATFGGTTASRNTVLNMKRGAEFDPNFQRLVTNKLVFPNLQNNDADAAAPLNVAGVLTGSHTAANRYDFEHSASDADSLMNFTNAQPGRAMSCTVTGRYYIGTPTEIAAGTAVSIIRGTGDPAGAVAAMVGSTFHRTDGGASTSLYVKESGGGGTSGWVGK